MRTIELKAYKFEELTESAKKAAREWHSKDGLDEFQCESITEGFQSQLEVLGLPTEKVHWSISYCQGDGVAFYGSVDVEEYLKKNKLLTKFRKLFDSDKDLLVQNVEIKSNSPHYNHYNTMTISYNEALYNGYQNDSRLNAIDDFIEHLSDHIKEISKDFYDQGQKEVDYCYSDEYINESIIANDYEFTEDGDII